MQRANRGTMERAQDAPQGFLPAFREALASFPSGVTVVTTMDEQGHAKGFTATAFTSVSASPAQILVCLDRLAECYPSFESSSMFVVNILAKHQEQVATRFATKGGDKFQEVPFARGEHGMPVLEEAVAVLECGVADRVVSGDHLILIGNVVACRSHGHEPLVYFKRAFHHVAAKVLPADG
jgi:flavin reductase ActVB